MTELTDPVAQRGVGAAARRARRREQGGLMAKYKLEYIWLDGYEPVPNLRGKTKIEEFDGFPTLEELPIWGFDGSSTRQAEGSNSDCLLHPVAVFPDPAQDERRARHVRGAAARTARRIRRNSRATIPDDPDTWFGFEQEYFLYRDGVPLGFPREGFPPPQGEYYTGVGYKNVGDDRARDRRHAPRPLPRGRASTTRASTPRSRRASGSSRSSARARRGPPTRCGSPATCCCASASATAST